ncbi:MAG: hypothetical protein AB7U20_03235 [Planctomycetaceae bacterium]
MPPVDANQPCSAVDKLAELQSFLKNVTPRKNGFTASCPAHDDEQASLSVKAATDGTLLVKCHAGCNFKSIAAALNKPAKWFFPGAPTASRNGRARGELVAIYDYRDAARTMLYQSCRFESPNGDGKPRKAFSQRTPDGNGGWLYKLNGVARVPYRLPELIAADPCEPVLIVEGEKHVDRLRALGFVATCNSGGAGKWLKSFSPYLAGRDVIVLPDNDHAGCKHARVVHDALTGTAASVRVLTLDGLPDRGDVIDWLEAGGTADQLRELLPTAQTIDEALPGESCDDQPQAADDRIRIAVTHNQHDVIHKTIDALAKDQSIYKRAGQLVHVIRERSDAEEDGIRRSAGTPRIKDVSAGYLRERLSAGCRFVRVTDDGDQQVAPPGFAVSAIHTRGFWEPIRQLTGIVETPVLKPDGTILDRPGWDESTGLLYEPGDLLPTVPDRPDLSDAIHAAQALLDLVSDFPFAAETHRSSWIAGLLTVLARRAFAGPAPMFLIDANVRGSGKSLLTDLIAIITTGRGMPRLSNPGDDDEARKRITSLALAGDPLVLIDNIGSTLGSASLDAALTSTTWKDRRLGANEIVECALRAVWFATGNNVMLAADTSRRVCHVRLDSPLESPEERTGFQHPNLLQHVRQNRLELLTAGLTILRAYVVARRPDAGLKPWGSFEGWSSLIRNAVVWLGLSDPGETRRELAEASDRDAAALRALFAGWSEIDPAEEGLTAAELVKRLETSPNHYDDVRSALNDLCDIRGKGLTGRAVGNQLRRFRGRVIGDLRLEAVESRTRVRRWRVSAVCAVCVSHPLAREFLSLSGAGEEVEASIERAESDTADTACGQCLVCGFELSTDCDREDCPTLRNSP